MSVDNGHVFFLIHLSINERLELTFQLSERTRQEKSGIQSDDDNNYFFMIGVNGVLALSYHDINIYHKH